QATQAVQLRANPLGIKQRAASIAQVNFAGGSEDHPACGAIKQLHAQLILELRNRAADCRCRDVQPIRRFADGTSSGDLLEIAQIAHSEPLSHVARLATGFSNYSICSNASRLVALPGEPPNMLESMRKRA